MFSWLGSWIRSLVTKILRILGFRPRHTEITLRVHIKTTSGRSFLVDLNPKWDISQVKKHVAPLVGLQAESLSIIFAGKDLDDHLKLEVCSLIHHTNWLKDS